MNTALRHHGPIGPDCGKDHDPVAALIEALARRNVGFCHWKSNVRLAESLDGEEDLDLLVRRTDACAFHAALAECGFAIAESRAGGGHPSVLHAFALDPARARLVHVHAYFRIVTGDSLVKSYHLPFEELFLTNLQVLHGLPVPPAEIELMVFLLRIALKHLSAFERYMVSRHYDAVPLELAWLRARADMAAARSLWCELIPRSTGEEFDELLEAVADPAQKRKRAHLGRRLSRRIAVWRRIGPAASFASRGRRVGLLIAARLRRRRPLRLSSGGAVIALVGPKASGKSTLGAALDKRLGQHLDVRRIHVGKPPPTPLTAPLAMALPLLRKAFPRERSGEYQATERRVPKNYSLIYVLRMALLAHDRRKLVLASRRAAMAGAIVIADRYPSGVAGAVDGNQFETSAITALAPGPKRWLMQYEAKSYEDLPRPDLVIRLVAPIETTLQRDATRQKCDGPDPESVLRRHGIETGLEFPGSRVINVNTDLPLEQTIREVLQAAWSGL